MNRDRDRSERHMGMAIVIMEKQDNGEASMTDTRVYSNIIADRKGFKDKVMAEIHCS